MSTKLIPHHFAMTQFRLDMSQPNTNAQVFVATPIDLPRPRQGSYQGQGRSGSQSRPKSPGFQRPAEPTERSRREQFTSRKNNDSAARPTSASRQTTPAGPSIAPHPPSHGNQTRSTSARSAYSSRSRNSSAESTGSLDESL